MDIAYDKSALNGSLNITELTIRFSKLVLTEAGLQLSKSMKPVLFLSVEFFDFELQTTPLLQGPEYIILALARFENLMDILIYIVLKCYFIQCFRRIITFYLNRR